MIKKLHKCITAVTVAAFLLPQIQVAAIEQMHSGKIVTKYNASEDKFSAEINMPEASKKFVTVVIAPNGDSITSKEDLSRDDVILKTLQVGTDGTVKFDIVMPDSPKPRYVYNVSVEKESKSAMFSITSVEDIAPYLGNVNSGGLEEARAFVKDETVNLSDGNSSNEKKDFIASYVNAVKPAGGYAAAGLINAYMTGEGLYYVKSGKIKLREFFELYFHYFEKNYLASFDSLSDKMKNALERAFINNNAVSDFDTTYDNNIFAAEYTTAESALSLKNCLISYYQKNNLSLAAFYNIGNAFYQEKVFDELYKYASNSITLSSIKNAFDEEVKKQSGEAYKTQNAGSGSGSTGSGGSGGARGEISSKIINPTPSYADNNLITFKDMGNHWSANAVEEMCKRGIINGFEDSTYRPDLPVTRAEFVKMISKMLGLNETGNSGFSDVSENSWYGKYVAAVKNAGLVTGTGNRFMPDDYITRQDASVIIARMADSVKKVPYNDKVAFSDECQIADYAKDSVSRMASVGIITGYDGKFAPLDNITRGEVAALLMRTADYIK